MENYKKYLRSPFTKIKYAVFAMTFFVHEQINPYDGVNRSRWDVLFWTKQWNTDTVVMLIFFIAAGILMLDFLKYMVIWWKEIVDDFKIF